MDNTVFIQPKVTKTAAATGTNFDASVVKGDYTVHLRVTALTPDDATASFSFPDSVDAFTGSLPGPMFSLRGAITKDQPVNYSFNRVQYPGLRLGATSAVLRCNLDRLTGTSPSVTYEAWIEYQS